MKFAPAALIASVLVPLASVRALAGDGEKRALYTSAAVVSFFTPDKIEALKVTPEQEKKLKAIDDRRSKIWTKHAQEMGKVGQLKISEKEKDAKRRALETQVSDDLFKLYGEAVLPDQIKRMKQIILQVHGMELFDYPEVRDMLKIGDKERKALQDAWNKWASEQAGRIKADVKAKKIDNTEAERQSFAMTFSVPDKVREQLTPQQRKTLEDLLGEKHVYKK